MTDIFLSYDRADRDRAAQLVAALKDENFSVWWDFEVTPGKAFDDVIASALASARCVIVLWSTASVKSAWVREEATEGARRNILVPVLLDEVEIPIGFKRIHAARLVDWSGDIFSDRELKQLLSAARSLVTPPSLSRCLPEVATEDHKNVVVGRADNEVSSKQKSPVDPENKHHKALYGHKLTLNHDAYSGTCNLIFSPDQRLIASAGWERKEWYDEYQTDGVIKLWDLSTGTLKHTLTNKGDTRYNAMAFSPDGQSIVSCGATGHIGLEHGHLTHWPSLSMSSPPGLLMKNEMGSLNEVAYLSDDQLIVQGRNANNSWNKVVSLSTGTITAFLDGNDVPAHYSSFTRDGSYFATIDDKKLSVWKTSSREILANQLELDFSWKPESFNQFPFAVSSDGRLVAIVNSPRTNWFIMILDLSSGEIISALKMDREPKYFEFSPDGQLLAANCRYGTIALWDVKNGVMKQQLGQEIVGDMVRGLAFSPDGQLLAFHVDDIYIYERNPH